MLVAAGAAAFGALAAGGYGLYRLFNGSRSESTADGGGGCHGHDEDKQCLIESENTSSESVVDLNASSDEEQYKNKGIG